MEKNHCGVTDSIHEIFAQFLFFKKIFYLRERAQTEGGAEGEREGQGQADFTLSRELDVGLDSRTPMESPPET